MAKQLHEMEAWVNPDGTPTTQFAEAILELIKESDEMTTNKKLAQSRPSVTTPVAIYTAPDSKQGNKGTVITQFSASDPADAATYNVYIGTTADDTTKVVDDAVADQEGGCPPCLENAMINPSESLFVEASAADTIVFLVSGIEKR